MNMMNEMNNIRIYTYIVETNKIKTISYNYNNDNYSEFP